MGISLGTLGFSLLEKMLTGKITLRVGYVNKEEKGMLRAGYGSKDLLFFSINNSIPSFKEHWDAEVLSKRT